MVLPEERLDLKRPPRDGVKEAKMKHQMRRGYIRMARINLQLAQLLEEDAHESWTGS